MENKERIGRKRGVPNKITGKVKEAINQLIEDSLEGLKDDLKQLSPKDRLNVVTGLLKYVIPTLKAQEVSVTTADEMPTWVASILDDSYSSEE